MSLFSFQENDFFRILGAVFYIKSHYDNFRNKLSHHEKEALDSMYNIMHIYFQVSRFVTNLLLN